MNIYDFALQMEKDGEQYYRNIANQTNNAGLKSIMNMLADQELGHYKLIEDMAREDNSAFLQETKVLAKAKNIFQEMKDSGEDFEFEQDQVEIYKKAAAVEDDALDFYLAKAEESENALNKELFLKLAEEEKEHVILLNNLVEFVSSPNTWLADAEFVHLEDI